MADKTLNVRIRTKHDTEANWTANNPVLLDGEQGFVTGTTKYKIGDGTKKWSELSYHNTLTDSEKTKLSGIAAGANKTVVDSALSSTSTNPVQNKVINSALAGKAPTSHEHNYIKNNPYKASGVEGQAGYVLFAQLKITSAYANRPIEFELIRRASGTPCYVSVMFNNTDSTDPDLRTLYYFGSNYDVFIQKTTTSTWALYARKTEGYDAVTVARIQADSQGIEITHPGGIVTEKPTSNVIDATLGWQVGTAAKLGRDGDSSNPMTFNWSGLSGQPNWVWGGNDGNSMFVYNPSNFNVASAGKLTTSAGSATKPVYFSDGKPKECTYTLEKSVPSNAVFTDTKYSTGTASTSGLTKLYTGTGTATDGTMTQAAIKSALDSKAPSSHGTHVSYGTNTPAAPGTASAGTASTVSRSDHVHPVQTSVSGNAGSASKLATARKININGLRDLSISFDGSKDVTVEDYGYTTTIYVTQDTKDNPYVRFAHTSTSANYDDRTMVFLINSGYVNGGYGIVKVSLRADNIKNSENASYCELTWLVRNEFAADQLLVKGYAPKDSTQYADLYFKAVKEYSAITITPLQFCARSASYRLWTIESGTPRANPDIRTYSYTTTATDAGSVSYASSSDSATKLATARTLRTNLASTSTASFDGTGNVTPGVTGTLQPGNGGTGQTSLNASANALINSLDTGTATPADNDYYICQTADGGTNNTEYIRRKTSSLWNYIKSKLAKVATSGSYNDLTNKPTIPTVGNGTITITQNGTTKGTFTTNQSGNTTIALSDTGTEILTQTTEPTTQATGAIWLKSTDMTI